MLWTDNDTFLLFMELVTKLRKTFGEDQSKQACANMIREAVNDLIANCSQEPQEPL